MNYFSFKRPELAQAYCDSLEGKGIANAISGLFLAGPRRIGKSKFLTDELYTEAEKRNWVIVYVDLWANKNANPAILITEAIKNSISTYQSQLTKLIKAAKINKLNLMGTLSIDLSQSGLPENMTLAQGLQILYTLAEQPILLIVDEAQHALTTSDGLNTMFAIKSARDQMNTSVKPDLMLVFTGSNRDKLAHLVLKKDQPFYGSEITSFPLLTKDFSDSFTNWVNQNLASTNQFTKDAMWKAFKLVGHKPEIIRQITGRLALNGDAGQLAELLEKDSYHWQIRQWNEFENEFNSLTILQKIIIKLLITKGNLWSPFSECSMNYYKEMTGHDVSTATIQTAIQSLRERAFIWQSDRGSYALEDESFAEWYKNNILTGEQINV